jgi:hypothetical protein
VLLEEVGGDALLEELEEDVREREDRGVPEELHQEALAARAFDRGVEGGSGIQGRHGEAAARAARRRMPQRAPGRGGPVDRHQAMRGRPFREKLRGGRGAPADAS